MLDFTVIGHQRVSNNPSSLEIRLFGTPQLLLNGNNVEGLRRKNRVLLYYIAAEGGKSTCEKILSFFWPDRERSAAQPILRTMIHDLRKTFGDNFRANDQIIALAPEASVDVLDFLTALTSPELQQLTNALALYKGDFIEGFSLSDAPQFNDWVASERERYRLMAMNGFADLSHHYEVMHNYSEALEVARRALAFNSFQEDLQRDVMRLMYLSGDRAGVIRHYESLRKLLDEELGMPPMLETRALYDPIINDTFAIFFFRNSRSRSINVHFSRKIISTFPGARRGIGNLEATVGIG